jgi:hypothetical protein
VSRDRRFALLLVPMALSGCGPAHHVWVRSFLKTNRIAWDGLGRDPNRLVQIKRQIKFKEAETETSINRAAKLASLEKYSPARWSAHDAIESGEDKRLAKALVICRGCSAPSEDPELTGSIR